MTNQSRTTEQNRVWTANWRHKHPEEYRTYMREYFREYRKSPQYRVAHSLRSQLWAILGPKQLPGIRLEKLLGCTKDELLVHIANQFVPGMSWANYGEWQVDHKRCLASFDLTVPEQLREAMHFSNLQPLWAAENASKGAKSWDEFSSSRGRP